MKNPHSKSAFQGRVAIITGAGTGIGHTTALAFARGGATVVINDLTQSHLNPLRKKIEKIGGRCLSLPGDVSQQKFVRHLVKETLSRHRRIDILFNNAGILRATKVEAISLEEWELLMRVNVTAVFLCAQACLPTMKKQKYGRIINMSSSAGRSVSTLGGVHYTTSKAAVLGLTRHIAREMAPHGITSNAICPGLIDTQMARKNCSPAQLKRYCQSFPILRLGTPEEVAATVLFLASPEAGYITGASIDINGGDLML